MNILIIQLGRFGDILQTYPTVEALKKKWPEAQVHMIVRERFIAATTIFQNVQVHSMPTAEILAPVLLENFDFVKSDVILADWLKGFKSFDWTGIFNLSFSPASSYLTDYIKNPNTVIMGYSRTSDGYLDIVDDASAYFYAQVGIDKHNRIHICDLFALVSGVDLTDEDFQIKQIPPSRHTPLGQDSIVIHVGASQSSKKCSIEQWRKIINSLAKKTNKKIVLIGSSAEKINNIDESVLDLCGHTQFEDLYGIIQSASLLIGCDSVAIQIASLTNTSTLNISFSSVNFWETGPRATISQILRYENVADLNADEVVQTAFILSHGQTETAATIRREPGFGVIYSMHTADLTEWSWLLVRAIYMAGSATPEFSAFEKKAILNIYNLAFMGFTQAKHVLHPDRSNTALQLLSQGDTIMETLKAQCPTIAPIARWYQTEKTRIRPGSLKEVVEQTERVYKQLIDFCEKIKIKDVFQESNIEREAWKS